MKQAGLYTYALNELYTNDQLKRDQLPHRATSWHRSLRTIVETDHARDADNDAESSEKHVPEMTKPWPQRRRAKGSRR